MQLLCDKELARRLALSRRKIWQLNSTGGLPKPLRIGRSVRWDEGDVELWFSLNCPNREQFEQAKNRKGGGRNAELE